MVCKDNTLYLSCAKRSVKIEEYPEVTGENLLILECHGFFLQSSREIARNFNEDFTRNFLESTKMLYYKNFRNVFNV